MSNLARNHRNSDLGKIHIAKNQLGLTDEDYRAILLAKGGADSSAKLSHEGRLKVLSHFEKLGFQPKASAKNKRRKAGFSAQGIGKKQTPETAHTVRRCAAAGAPHPGAADQPGSQA